MFHKQQGNSDVAIPVIAHRPVDIWALRTEVRKHGGVDEVSLSLAVRGRALGLMQR
jgi:hypothetical protein